MKAREKEFNVILETSYDPQLRECNVVRQDIVRILLNIYNNSFYAVNDRKKKEGNGYDPKVSVSTSGDGEKVVITIRENGIGIPEKIRDRIFQPFFTTKPAGQGTGLGLSLSYDIVKAHGGELEVKTKEARPDDPVVEGEGTTFIMQIPVT